MWLHVTCPGFHSRLIYTYGCTAVAHIGRSRSLHLASLPPPQLALPYTHHCPEAHDASEPQESQVRRRREPIRSGSGPTIRSVSATTVSPPAGSARWTQGHDEHAHRCAHRGAPLPLLSAPPLALTAAGGPSLQIFSHMHPRDLLSLARTTRDLRAFLTSRRASLLSWRTARRRQAQSLPECPPFLSEVAYANLVFCSACDVSAGVLPPSLSGPPRADPGLFCCGCVL